LLLPAAYKGQEEVFGVDPPRNIPEAFVLLEHACTALHHEPYGVVDDASQGNVDGNLRTMNVSDKEQNDCYFILFSF
jgi:hypothetical protein